MTILNFKPPNNVSETIESSEEENWAEILLWRLRDYYLINVYSKVTYQKYGNAQVVLLYKEGNELKIYNDHPISLLPNPYKLLTNILVNRLTNHQSKPHFVKAIAQSSILQSLRTFIEKCNDITNYYTLHSLITRKRSTSQNYGLLLEQWIRRKFIID